VLPITIVDCRDRTSHRTPSAHLLKQDCQRFKKSVLSK
jgi:hypothetical protein